MASTRAIVQFIGRGVLEMGLVQEATAILSYGSLMGILEMVQNNPWELFHDLQNIHPVRRGNKAETRRVLGDLNPET
jgi:hypothetical protein